MKKIIQISCLIDVCCHLKKYDLAEKYCLKIMEINNSVFLVSRLGAIYYSQKKYELAEKYCLMAVEMNDDSSLYNLGLLYKAQQKNEIKIFFDGSY